MDPMEAIRATFFQECEELLASLEEGLTNLQAGRSDNETVNAVFRAVHSVKGGAGAFGLDSLVRFAHVFETTLDDLRAGRLGLDGALCGLLLRAADVLSDHVSEARGGRAVDAVAVSTVVGELQALGQTSDQVPPPDAGDTLPEFAPVTLSLDADAPVPPASLTDGTVWSVRFRPHAALYRNANDSLRLLRELERLGALEIELDLDQVGRLDQFDPDKPGLAFTAKLQALARLEREQIAEVFEFVDGDCDLTIEQGGGGKCAPAAEEDPETLLARLMSEVATPQPSASLPPAALAESAADLAPPTVAAAAESLVQTTIRVDLERVDRLIDLVGELVINQAMLAQRVTEAGLARTGAVAVGLEDLEQLTREIQDSVMAIRAQPVKSVFQRMPRLVREVAAATGKRVRLVTDGEATEVDKTVIERIAEPITHMIRNAIDHGLESPEDRLAAGKPAEGTVRLSALHRSGRIVIEVSDDGAGINRERVRAIAVQRNLIAADATLSDEEIDNLIFAPGFSTADAVSDISGRGVGMDVVRRSIQALGGRIGITSRPGEGSTFTLSLPLTLAVLDGMVLTVGDHTLVAPINVIVETLQPKASDIRSLGPRGSVLACRGSHVPLIDVATALGWKSSDQGRPGGVTLLVEGEMGLAALRVDGIQGQRQVVIKSLEQNYGAVEGVAAATILGDGRVALILDVDGLIAARARPAPAVPPLPLPQVS